MKNKNYSSVENDSIELMAQFTSFNNIIYHVLDIFEKNYA